MTLADGQYQFRGLVFGQGTTFELAGPIDGLEGFSVRVSDQELPRGHGGVPGKHYASPRQMLATFTLGDSTVAGHEGQLDTLSQAFPLAEDVIDELVWQEFGRPERMVRCRATAFARGDEGTSGRVSKPKVALLAADPRIYSSAERSALIPLYSSAGGGIDYPLANYPKNFPAGLQLEAVVHNDGRADAYPVVRFYGAPTGTIDSVTLINTTTDESVRIVTPITAGQILTADFGALVTASGAPIITLDGSSRYGAWQQPRTPLRLPPGDSVLRFVTVGSATTAQAVATWRDTWHS